MNQTVKYVLGSVQISCSLIIVIIFATRLAGMYVKIVSIILPAWLTMLAAISFMVSGILSVLSFRSPKNKNLAIASLVSNGVTAFWVLMIFLMSCETLYSYFTLYINGALDSYYYGYGIATFICLLLISLIMIADIAITLFVNIRNYKETFTSSAINQDSRII